MLREIIKKIKEKKINYAILLIIGIVISTILLFIGNTLEKFNLALTAILITYIMCILHTLNNIKYKMYYFLFLGVMFVFILSRPTISMLKGNIWWNINADATKWSLISIYVSLIGFLIGELISENLIRKKMKKDNEVEAKDSFINKNIYIIRNFSFIMFVVSFIATMAVEMDKFIFMIGKDYASYYILYKNVMPKIITFLASTMIVFFIVYLITQPSKKMSLIVLAMYILTTVPMLIIGERGSIVVAIIFAFVYIWYRNIIEVEEKWITKEKVIIMITILPIGIIGLGVYNYIRSDSEIPSYNPISIITDFFYKQGVTYDVLNIGYNSLDKLPNRESKNYTFGGLIDYIKYNTISVNLFDIEPLPNTNSVRKATEGNDFAHAMSYVAKKDYLQGHRMGVIIFVGIICRLWLYRNFYI